VRHSLQHLYIGAEVSASSSLLAATYPELLKLDRKEIADLSVKIVGYGRLLDVLDYIATKEHKEIKVEIPRPKLFSTESQAQSVALNYLEGYAFSAASSKHVGYQTLILKVESVQNRARYRRRVIESILKASIAALNLLATTN
jgi:hypothetical protein